MITASVPATGNVNSSIHLANLKPSKRMSFIKALKDNCCPELEDGDVEKAMKLSLDIESFDSESHGDGYTAFRATLPDGKILVTSRMQLRQWI